MNPIDPLGKGHVEPSRVGNAKPLDAATPIPTTELAWMRRFVGDDSPAPRVIGSADRVAAIEGEIVRSFGAVLPPDAMAAILAAVERNPEAQRLLDRAIAETPGPAATSTLRRDDSRRHGDST